jgi:hypothetical protein
MPSYYNSLNLIPYNKITDYGLSLNGRDIVTNCYGFSNRQKDIVIQCKYDLALPFSEGLAAVCLRGKWGFIDESGVEVVPCKYFHVGDFSEGLALVGLLGRELEYDEDDNVLRWEHMFGYINKSGVVVIPLQYEAGTEFREGHAFVNVGGETEFSDKPYGGKWHKIDKDGHQQSAPFQFHGEYYVYDDNGNVFEYDFFQGNYVWESKFESRNGYEGYTSSELTEDYIYPDQYPDKTKGFKRIGALGWRCLEDGTEYWEVTDAPSYKHPNYRAIMSRIREERNRQQEQWDQDWEYRKDDFEDMADEDDEMRDMDETDPTWRIANDFG